MNDTRPSSHQHNTLETTCQGSTKEHKCDISLRVYSKGFSLLNVCGGLTLAVHERVQGRGFPLASLNFSKAPLTFSSPGPACPAKGDSSSSARSHENERCQCHQRERRRGRAVTDHDTMNLVLYNAREDSSTPDPLRSALPRSSRRRRLRSSCRWRPQLLTSH